MSAPIYRSADPIMVINRQFVCTQANSPFSHLCQRPIDQIVGHPAAELLGLQTFYSVLRPHFERAFSGQITYFEGWLPCQGQPRYVGAHCFPTLASEPQDGGLPEGEMPSGHVEQVVVALRDLTEARGAEEAVQRFRRDFVQLAAHEMKTPLATLRGHVQLLQRAGGHDDHERRALAALERQTRRLVRLAQALVDMSYIQSGEWSLSLSPTHLQELVQEAIGAFGDPQPIAISLANNAEPSVVVDVDRPRILEVVDNLLDNAVRYGLGNGPIEVSIRNGDGEAVVSVHDHGPGMPAEVQERLFEPWYQTAPMVRPTAGMGLGLYISREIIRRHGGRIWVESEQGRGSTFSFSLPLSSGDGDAPPAPVP